jgi:hypothetical protein
VTRVLTGLAGLALILAASFWWLRREVSPPVQSIVSSSLSSLHEQSRLSAFAARFVTAVTSSRTQFGLNAEKTLILPGMIRYEVDLEKLSHKDVRWDAARNMLTITLPPIEISGPEFDLEQTREYESGMVLMALTDVEKVLDAQNREKARLDILEQARSETTMKLARDATVRAVANSFAMPLRAAGIEAQVKVEFAR